MLGSGNNILKPKSAYAGGHDQASEEADSLSDESSSELHPAKKQSRS